MANFMLFMILSSLMHIQNYEFLAGLGLVWLQRLYPGSISVAVVVMWWSVYITDESFSI